MTIAERIALLPWRSMSVGEVAGRVGCSPATARTTMRRMDGYVEPATKLRGELIAAEKLARIERMRLTPDRIELTRGKFALIDPEDFEMLAPIHWIAHLGVGGQWYAVASGNRKMHRLILGAKRGQLVDHINGNPLDNRRRNLRVCDSQQNSWNVKKIGERSRFKGVWPNGPGWCAMITLDGQRTYLGQFATEEEAAIAYDKAAQEHRGEFAWLNSERIAV